MESGSGMADSATVEIEGYYEKLKEDYIKSIPNCDSCGEKMSPKKNWDGKTKPNIVCKNVKCKDARLIPSTVWKPVKNGE